MYSTLENQLPNILRYIFSFVLIFVVWAGFIFNRNGDRLLDRLVDRYVKMVFLIIILVYILVLIGLYEVLSIGAILIGLTFYVNFLHGAVRAKASHIVSTLPLRIYDFLEGKIGLRAKFVKWYRAEWEQACRNVSGLMHSTVLAGFNMFLLVLTLAYSAYLRFYDAIVHAAPALSDAYVTLAWMKYIEKKILFHDGIYPQGFHIYLSVLHKFAGNNGLYILKYTGPLNSLLTAAGFYFLVSRISGRRTAGIIAALAFGLFIPELHLDWARQIAANSQEFAMVFILPCWYYAFMYLKKGIKHDLWAAFACMAISGLVHTIAFAFSWLGLLAIAVTYLFTDTRTKFKPVLVTMLAGVMASVLSTLPILLGFLMGRGFHGSSADFLTQKISVTMPEFNHMDILALTGTGVFFLACLVVKRLRPMFPAALFVFFMTTGSLFMYMYIGVLTQNAVLATRGTLLWGLVAPLGLGFGWAAIEELIPDQKFRQYFGTLAAGLIVAGALIYFNPQPYQPGKLQYDSAVDQYLRITTEYLPTTWMIVSPEEGYSLSLGIGYHMMLGDFLDKYNPAEKKLIDRTGGGRAVLDTPDIFIFMEKKQYPVILPEMKPILERRADEYRQLEDWLNRYTAAHKNLTVYYEDNDIKVLHINQPKSKEETFKEIWGIDGE